MTLTSTPASSRWTAAVCLNRCGLTERFVRVVVEVTGEAAHDLVDAEPGQRPPRCGDEDGVLAGRSVDRCR